jgi:hypothetical protein
MRKLQDQLKSLVLAAAELDELEKDHYDDRAQAQREIERLQRLITDGEAAIDTLRDETRTKKRTYALLPYEGPNGTLRRAIYIECVKDELILQPEGVRITRDDLRPPVGSGNPLACALRAARDHMIERNPEEGKNRDTEPYPMLLIRPEGTAMFGPARKAIEAADFDFGFEPVEDHWELNFGAPDPQLANAELQAIEQSRIRQRLLAAAAPRAYRNPELGAAGRFEFDDEPSGASGESFERRGGTSAGPALFGPSTQVSAQSGQVPKNDVGAADGSGGGTGKSEPGESGDSGVDGEKGDETPPAVEGDNEIAGAHEGTPPPQGKPLDNSQLAGASNTGGAPNSAATQGGGTGGDSSDPQAAAASSGAVAGQQAQQQEFDPHKQIKTEWTPPRTNTRAVAVRRMVRVIVRDDHFALLSDESRSARSATGGRTIPLEGDTVESMDQFVSAVKDHVAEWGIAGNGLYWRPVLELQVGPDGQRRAEDLMRLLKDSDIEVQLPTTANRIPQGASRAAR